MSRMAGLRSRGRKSSRSERGQALVEFALILPVLLVLVFGIIKMGIAANSWSDETHMANEAARYAAVNSCSACAGSPIDAWILTQGDTADLRDSTKTNVTITFKDPIGAGQNHCVGDPVEVKVSYTYTLLDLPILPKFTSAITATSTQRLEANWKGDGAGNKDPSDNYNASNASHDSCP